MTKVIHIRLTLDLLVPEDEYTQYTASTIPDLEHLADTAQECIEGGWSGVLTQDSVETLEGEEAIRAVCGAHGTDPDFFLLISDYAGEEEEE